MTEASYMDKLGMHSDHMSLDQMALVNCDSHNLSFHLTYGDNIFTHLISLKKLE